MALASPQTCSRALWVTAQTVLFLPESVRRLHLESKPLCDTESSEAKEVPS